MRARWSLVILGCGVASLCAHLVAAGAFSGLRPLSADQQIEPDSPYLGGGAFTDFADLTEAMATGETAEADPVEATEAVEETETAETVPEEIPDPADMAETDPPEIVPDSPEMAPVADAVADTVTDEIAVIPTPTADIRPRERTRPEEPKPEPATRQKPAEKKKAAPQKTEPARKAAKPAPKTGASRGSTSQGDASSAGTSTAARTYPAEVQRRIARTRQRRSGAPGRVVVAFSVNGSGGLTGLSIAQSSGKSSTDQAALDHIRRAAPFPAPPAGARRNFRIPVSVK